MAVRPRAASSGVRPSWPPDRTARERNHPLRQSAVEAVRSDGLRARLPARVVRRRGRSIGRPANSTAHSGSRPSWPRDRTKARAARPFQRLRPRPCGAGPGRPSARPGGRPECRRIPRTGPTDRTAPPLIVR